MSDVTAIPFFAAGGVGAASGLDHPGELLDVALQVLWGPRAAWLGVRPRAELHGQEEGGPRSEGCFF